MLSSLFNKKRYHTASFDHIENWVVPLKLLYHHSISQPDKLCLSLMIEHKSHHIVLIFLSTTCCVQDAAIGPVRDLWLLIRDLSVWNVLFCDRPPISGAQVCDKMFPLKVLKQLTISNSMRYMHKSDLMKFLRKKMLYCKKLDSKMTKWIFW